MKVYRYKFSRNIIILIIASILLCLLSLGLSLQRLTLFKGSSFYNKATMVVMLIVSAVLTVVLFSLIISSVYKIGPKRLVIRFGVVYSYIKIQDIVKIKLYEKTEKLVLYFGMERYTVIVVKKEWYDDFTDALLKANPKIAYEKTSVEEEKE